MEQTRVDKAYEAVSDAIQCLVTALNEAADEPPSLSHHWIVVADERSSAHEFVNVFTKPGDAPWDSNGMFTAAQFNGQWARALTGMVVDDVDEVDE